MSYVGVMGIEMFLCKGKILVNELAPRVHNSGHYTIEGCHTSQFENHVRAILGLPLGSTEMKVPSAVMINILGERNGEAKVEGIDSILACNESFIHLYGKSETRIGRKMGHITVTGTDPEELLNRAAEARRAIGI
ncbi:MAG: ATP-grasp domain-containing protein [Ignavibacteria bacterium]|nr:ATP-grasp domain-containing protein [Ignavibacteria bacterium]